MGEREELERQRSVWTVKKQEAEDRLKAIEPKAVDVSGGREPERFVFTTEKMAEIESVRREIEEAEAKLREIREKLSRLPREQG